MGLRTADFRVEPLGVEHNERDYAAWTSSIEHIRSTPGFAGRPWPREGLTLADNLSVVERHARDFAARTEFVYTVLDGETVIGGVNIGPGERPGTAEVRSWVRADHADLDAVLYRTVREWLKDWPFESVRYRD